jgi:hypothetical protein
VLLALSSSRPVTHTNNLADCTLSISPFIWWAQLTPVATAQGARAMSAKPAKMKAFKIYRFVSSLILTHFTSPVDCTVTDFLDAVAVF